MFCAIKFSSYICNMEETKPKSNYNKTAQPHPFCNSAHKKRQNATFLFSEHKSI